MNGVLNKPNTLTDTLLQRTAQKSEASVPKPYQKGFRATMAAGLQTMFSEQTFPEMQTYMKTIKGPQDVPKIVSHGIVKLMTIMMNETKGKMPLETSGVAALVLMTHALQYVETLLKINITKDILAQTTQLVSQGMLLILKQASKLSDSDFDLVMQGKHPAQQKRGGTPPVPQAAPQAMPPAAGPSPMPVGAPPMSPMTGGM